MTREQWVRLRGLPENIHLSEEEFQRKYSHLADVDYRETKTIKGLKEMKQGLREMKAKTDKKTVLW